MSREALYDAVKAGIIVEFRRLVDEGVDPRQRHPTRGSLLAEAVLSNLPEMVAAVLSSPARELLGEDVFGAPLIFLALRAFAQLEVLRLLLEAGAPATTGSLTAGIAAACHPDPCVLALALDHTGEDVNARPRGCSTALEVAAEAGRLESVRLLLARGANAHDVQPYGVTPIALACDSVDPEATEEMIVDMIRVLAEAGCPVRTRNPDGETALHMAVHRRRAKVVRALIAMGLSASEDEDGGEALREEAIGLGIDEL